MDLATGEHTCIYMHVHVHVYMTGEHTCIYMHVHVHVYMQVNIHVHMWIESLLRLLV